ncbi:sigma 54-interacting transcriptional regulator [Sorangium sp. So ce185]|uniref:sigma 54-interacting transcriptional regulator n=1 Tax=Sorangium sp. So ce185 TaxID=3133287 RepID=UPI003F5FA923
MKPEDKTLPVERSAEGLKLRSNKIRIDVVKGPAAGANADLPGPEVRIGSSEECDFVLEDPTVSRVHLILRIEGDAIRVIDAGSRNGTSIDGTQVRDAYARPDSSIAVGGSTLHLRMLTDVVEVPLSANDRFGRLLGGSVAMRRVFALLERLAPTDATLLVEGETGTGKELVAAGVHENSARAAGPFAVFDCSAVTPSLMESELFGHVRGAFTGALTDRAGAFEEADGGTLFLDEIGELPIELQPKLLRALESREVRRVGSNKPRRVDVRIIAATNRSLSKEVERGEFREDLYYRLAVITVRLPPLRERLEDVPLLVRHFEQERAIPGSPRPPLPDAVLHAFSAQSWPGNVRELRNAVERALSLGGPGARFQEVGLAPIAATLNVSLDVPLLIGRDRVAEAYERAYLEIALKQAGGNVCRTAELAGVGRNFVQKAMKRYGLRGGAGT